MQEFARQARSQLISNVAGKLAVITATALLVGLGTTASAQTQDIRLQDAEVSAGLGVATTRDLYRGVGSKFSLLPLVSIESGDFQLFANEAGLKVHENDLFDVLLIGQYRFDGYESDDSNFLNGMGDRRGALEFGVGMTSEQWFGQFVFSALTDVTSRHKGHEIEISYGYPLALGGAIVTPQVSLAWQSGDLVNYYWGVRDSEARLGRPEYVPGSSINLEVAVIYQRQLGKRHSFIGKFSLLRPGSAIDNSPLRDADDPYSLGIGYLYKF